VAANGLATLTADDLLARAKRGAREIHDAWDNDFFGMTARVWSGGQVTVGAHGTSGVGGRTDVLMSCVLSPENMASEAATVLALVESVPCECGGGEWLDGRLRDACPRCHAVLAQTQGR
jgi:hypothetical protein